MLEGGTDLSGRPRRFEALGEVPATSPGWMAASRPCCLLRLASEALVLRREHVRVAGGAGPITGPSGGAVTTSPALSTPRATGPASPIVTVR